MIWGGGVGAKKLIGYDANESASVLVKGYQRPRKIANSWKGIRSERKRDPDLLIFDPSSTGFVFIVC